MLQPTKEYRTTRSQTPPEAIEFKLNKDLLEQLQNDPNLSLSIILPTEPLPATASDSEKKANAPRLIVNGKEIELKTQDAPKKDVYTSHSAKLSLDGIIERQFIMPAKVSGERLKEMSRDAQVKKSMKSAVFIDGPVLDQKKGGRKSDIFKTAVKDTKRQMSRNELPRKVQIDRSFGTTKRLVEELDIMARKKVDIKSTSPVKKDLRQDIIAKRNEENSLKTKEEPVEKVDSQLNARQTTPSTSAPLATPVPPKASTITKSPSVKPDSPAAPSKFKLGSPAKLSTPTVAGTTVQSSVANEKKRKNEDEQMQSKEESPKESISKKQPVTAEDTSSRKDAVQKKPKIEEPKIPANEKISPDTIPSKVTVSSPVKLPTAAVAESTEKSNSLNDKEKKEETKSKIETQKETDSSETVPSKFRIGSPVKLNGKPSELSAKKEMNEKKRKIEDTPTPRHEKVLKQNHSSTSSPKFSENAQSESSSQSKTGLDKESDAGKSEKGKVKSIKLKFSGIKIGGYQRSAKAENLDSSQEKACGDSKASGTKQKQSTEDPKTESKSAQATKKEDQFKKEVTTNPSEDIKKSVSASTKSDERTQKQALKTSNAKTDSKPAQSIEKEDKVKREDAKSAAEQKSTSRYNGKPKEEKYLKHKQDTADKEELKNRQNEKGLGKSNSVEKLKESNDNGSKRADISKKDAKSPSIKLTMKQESEEAPNPAEADNSPSTSSRRKPLCESEWQQMDIPSLERYGTWLQCRKQQLFKKIEEFTSRANLLKNKLTFKKTEAEKMDTIKLDVDDCQMWLDMCSYKLSEYKEIVQESGAFEKWVKECGGSIKFQ